MPIRRQFHLAILLSLSCICAHAQMAPSDPVAMNASLAKFQRQRVEWEKTIRSVKVEELHIGSADRKGVQEWLDLCLGELSNASRDADGSLSSGRLVAVAVFAKTLKDLETNLEHARRKISEVAVDDEIGRKKRDAWSKALSDIGCDSGTPLDVLYNATNEFVWSRIVQLEDGCSK